METTELKIIKLSALVPSKTNPRKQFDGAALQELSASIKEKGVLQPIVVRRHGKTKYEVVCGERRYRASLLAGVETIPAVIRDLHDDEALELQIVENLQRKDVHPMDEAAAFLNLVDVFRMSTEEIALRVGKSQKYVARRLKLNDLLPDFQEMFYLDKIPMKDATLLSRASEEAQKMILKENCKGWKGKDDFHLSSLHWYMGRTERDLDEAAFKTEDSDLYPDAGPCGSCRYNTANSPLLFEDKQGRICTNPTCFQIKVERAFKQNLESVIADPDVLFVKTSWGDGEEKVKMVEEMGIRVIANSDFDEIRKPRKPRAPKDSDDDQSDYQEAVEEYQAELEDYNKAVAAGEIRKAFVVEGYHDEGKFIEVRLTGKGKALAGTAPDSMAEEIAGIESREARAKELDQEKIFKRVSEQLSVHGEYLTNPEELTAPERVAMAMMMYGFAGYGIDEFLRNYGIEREQYGDYTKKDLFVELTKKLTPELLNKLIRRVILDQLINSTEINPERHGKAMAIMGIAEHYFPDKVKEIQLEQQEKAAKRAERVKQRIEGLKKKAEEVES